MTTTLGDERSATTIQENKTLYRRFIQEVFNEGRLVDLDQFVAPSYVIQDAPPETPPGAQGVRQIVSMFRAGFPDLKITIQDLVAEGDKVCARSILRGTHKGAIFGIPPTGKAVTMASLTMVRISDGHLVESCVKNDVAGLMRQLK